MGLLDGYPGLGAGGNIDLNQLVRPPDPLGAALGEISQRLAVAGQASRLPTSTLGAIGSALGGASTAAQTQQTQYLDQAIKLQALKRSLMQAGYDAKRADLFARWAVQSDPSAASGTPAAPGVAPASAVPGVLPGAAPVAPVAAPGAPTAIPGRPVATPVATPSPDYGASGDFPTGLGYNTAPGGPIINSGLLSPDTVGGAGAAISPNLFRLASLVAPAGDGSGSGVGSGTADPLGLIAKYESGGRNIRQQVVPESVSSASGPWQMLNSTFHETAKKAGIDTSQYKSAQDAPIEVQRAVAQVLYNEKGFAPWANYNPKLAAATGGGTPTGGTASPVSTLRGLLAGSDGGSSDPLAGLLALAGAGGGDKGGADEDPLAGLLKPQDEVIPSGGGLPAGMLRNASAGAGNAGYPIPNILPPGGNAAFPALPATGDNQIPVAGPGAPDTVIRGDLPADAQQVGDRLIGGPSTQRSGMMMAQYAPGGGPPAGSGAAAVASALGGAPPLVTPSTGKIPGINMTPQQLAILDAFSSLAGDTSKPFKDFLDIYYKSPEYLRQSAQETAQGQRAVTEPSDIRIAQQRAVEDRTTNYLKTIGDARFALAPNGILVPDGQGGMKRVQATVEQAVKAANGLSVPELGIQGMYPDTRGGTTAAGQPTRSAGPIAGEPTAALPPGYQWQTSPEGKTTAQPIPNTPEAAAAEALAKTRAVADRGLQMSRDIVVQNSDRLENMVKDSALPVTGAGGSFLSRVGGTAANDARVLIETMRARMSLDQLNALRAASPTGGALGNVSNAEGDRLAAAMSNLDQSQSKDQFLFNLRRAKEAYVDAVHGPGAWKQMSDEPVLKTQPQSREWKEGQILNYPDGSQHQLTNGQWIAIKPPTQR